MCTSLVSSSLHFLFSDPGSVASISLSEGVGKSDTKDSSLSTRVAVSEDTELRDPSLLRKCNFEPMSDDARLKFALLSARLLEYLYPTAAEKVAIAQATKLKSLRGNILEPQQGL